LGHQSGGQAPGLEDYDLGMLILQCQSLVNDSRDLRGLARSGGSREHQSISCAQSLRHGIADLVDGQWRCARQPVGHSPPIERG
jgi:hypothetical protein